MKIGEFTLYLKKILGKGAFAEVFLATKEGSKELYAAKRLDREKSDKPKNMKRLNNEITILKEINHPNIIRIIDIKKAKTHYYIITEFCNGGSLSNCLKKYIMLYQKPFPDEIVQYLMRQIVDAIYYLHSKKIIHRDLKLDNILVNFLSDEDLNSLNMMRAVVKIIDFGFARRIDPSNGNKAHSVLGTPNYMEPKILQNMETKTKNIEGYDEKADIWSLGVLCHEMLVGHMTFDGKNNEEIYQKVREGTYSLPLDSLKKEEVSFINGMLQSDPNRRLSAEELLNHNFLVKDVKQFEPIDHNQIQGKISGDQMNINYKNNRTIWSIFNQENSSQNNTNNNNNINNNENIINQQSNQQFIQKQYLQQNQPNKQITQQHHNIQHQFVSSSVPPTSAHFQNQLLFQGSNQMDHRTNQVPFSSQIIYGNSPQLPIE